LEVDYLQVSTGGMISEPSTVTLERVLEEVLMASGLTPWPPDCPAIPYADCQRVVCANLRGKGWNEEARTPVFFFVPLRNGPIPIRLLMFIDYY